MMLGNNMKSRFDHGSFKILLRTLKRSDLLSISKSVNDRLAELSNVDLKNTKPTKHEKLPSLSKWRKMSGQERHRVAFTTIMNDDWSHLFLSYDNNIRDYYVYYHSEPRSHQSLNIKDVIKMPLPFYIGKGKGDRLFSVKRTIPHQNKLKQLFKKSSMQSIAGKYKENLTEAEALEIESKLILFFGCSTADNSLKSFFGRNCLFNRQYEPYPISYDRYSIMSHSISGKGVN